MRKAVAYLLFLVAFLCVVAIVVLLVRSRPREIVVPLQSTLEAQAMKGESTSVAQVSPKAPKQERPRGPVSADAAAAEKELAAAWDKVQSVVLSVKGNNVLRVSLPDGREERGTSTNVGRIEYAREGDRVMLRAEMTNLLEPETEGFLPRLENQVLAVSDGVSAYTEMEMGAKKNVRKVEPGLDMCPVPLSAEQIVDALSKRSGAGEVTVSSARTDAGEDVYVFESRPADAGDEAAQKSLTMRFHVAKDTGIPIKSESLDKEGNVMNEMHYTVVSLGEPIGSERFTYSPPAETQPTASPAAPGPPAAPELGPPDGAEEQPAP